MMKYRYLLVVFITLIVAINTFAQDGRELLQSALKSTQTKSFQAKMQTPVSHIETSTEVLPYTDTWQIYREFTPEGVFLRLETFSKDRLIGTYINNSTGSYGDASSLFAAKIIENPYLWYIELLSYGISDQELQLSTFEVNHRTFNSKPCYQIVMKTPRSDTMLQKLTGEDLNIIKEKREFYLQNRTFSRTLIIDKQHNFIVARSHYNAKGNLIFNIELDSFVIAHNSLELFDTPDDIKGVFLTRYSFASKALTKMIELKKVTAFKRFRTWLTQTGSDTLLWILKYGGTVMLWVAILALISIVGVKIYNKRKA